MKKTLTEQLEKKRTTLVERTVRFSGLAESEVRKLLLITRQQSIRINSLHRPHKETLEELHTLGWQGRSYDWMPAGYNVESSIEVLRDSQAVAEGNIFIQNAASWIPVIALDPKPGEIILDVCAAPGGKTSHIADITQNKAHIFANDNSRPRLAKLRINTERLGAEVEKFTLFDATQLARKYGDLTFDKILLDAPCSGEGLMSLDNDKSFNSWSVAHIKRLQRLQKRIISQAWQLLRPGGVLVYSTCTMAPEENEAVIDYMVRTRADVRIEPLSFNLPNQVHPVAEWNDKVYDMQIRNCLRLMPSENIEAFFVAKCKKVDPSRDGMI